MTFRALPMGAALTGAVLLALSLTACETTQDQVSRREDHLAAAGFMVRPADTAQRQKMLASLPSHHFVRRVHADSVNYVYADPLVCDCLYVGSQVAYDQYRSTMEQQHLANEEAMTAQTYADPEWNWSAWGGGGYDFGPGLGW
jgi:hypothetical protein